MQKKTEICESGLSNLRIAIIKQAKADYIKAVKSKNENMIDELERFFRSQWCFFLTGGVDGVQIIKSLNLQAQYEIWRSDHKCSKCKRERCIHKNGNHYTAMEKGELICEKVQDGKER